MHKLFLLKSIAILLVFSPQSYAHFPLMNCYYEEANIICQAGYSDGSSAIDYVVKMYDYEDNLIAKATTNKASKATFSHPNQDFYLIFDAGHESPVEVDIVEIKKR